MDAPVSSGEPEAVARTLAVMAGGRNSMRKVSEISVGILEIFPKVNEEMYLPNLKVVGMDWISLASPLQQ